MQQPGRLMTDTEAAALLASRPDLFEVVGRTPDGSLHLRWLGPVAPAKRAVSRIVALEEW